MCVCPKLAGQDIMHTTAGAQGTTPRAMSVMWQVQHPPESPGCLVRLIRDIGPLVFVGAKKGYSHKKTRPTKKKAQKKITIVKKKVDPKAWLPCAP